MRIGITGSTGLVGTRLSSALCARGDRVVPFVRREGAEGIHWEPLQGRVDLEGCEGLDAVIHLAGENVASGRWSSAKKDAILQSRKKGTQTLCTALSSLDSPPKVFLSASGINYYGERGDEEVDEESPSVGDSFLTQVCRAWEAPLEGLREAGVRASSLRIGLVLAREGGALAKMLLPFRLGLGGRIGSGRQWMSWIDIDDLVGAFLHVLDAPQSPKALNFIAPTPVTNREFSATLARVLKRPAIFPLPSFLVRILFGEMGETLLLSGQRVLPAELERAGFSFAHPQLEGALRHVLNKPQEPSR